MRFRLGISGNQQTADSFGRGFQSLAMLPMLQAQAGEEFQNGELKRAHLASQMASEEAQRAQAQAHAALFGQQAEAERQKIERGGLGETLTTAALMNRLPLPQAQEFRDYATTGQLAGKYDTGGLPGPVMPTPDYANPSGLGGQIMQTLGLLRGGLTVGGKIDDVTNAQGQLQKQEAVRAVTADPTRAPAVGQAYAAIDGKPLVENIGNTGEGFNKFTGQGTTLNQGLRVLYDQGERAQINQRNAAAGASNASAEHSRASTEKVRQDTEQGARGVLVQTEAGPVFSDPRTGASVAVRNPDGTPATVAPKPLPEAAQKQIIGARNVQEAAQNYIGMLKRWSKTDALSPSQRASMGTAYNNLMLQAKEAYNLGVLNGPDYSILQSVVADPTKLGSAIVPTDALTKQANELARIASGIEAQVLKAHGKPVPANADPLGLRR